MQAQFLGRGQGFRQVGLAVGRQAAERIALQAHLERADTVLGILGPACRRHGQLGPEPSVPASGAAGGEHLPPVPGSLRSYVLT